MKTKPEPLAIANAHPPCTHCGGFIGPDQTGRPACYGCAPTSTLLDVTCPKCGKDRKLPSADNFWSPVGLWLICPCGTSTKRSELRPSIRELERLIDVAISEMATDPTPYELPHESPPAGPRFGESPRQNARPQPPLQPVVCATCGLRSNEGHLTPDGWALFTFPVVQGQLAEIADAEHQHLCPPCGEKVAKFIAHLSTPSLDDEDLL